MLGTIEEISNNIIDVKLTIDIKKTPSLINLYVLIKDNQKSFIGEVIEANLTHCKINILGKLEGSNFLYGFDQKPSFASLVYLLNYDFVQNIVGFKENYLLMGKSPYYDNVNITAADSEIFNRYIIACPTYYAADILITAYTDRACNTNIVNSQYII